MSPGLCQLGELELASLHSLQAEHCSDGCSTIEN
jgi:hypothetical protein